MSKIKYVRGSKEHAKQIRLYFKNQGSYGPYLTFENCEKLYFANKHEVDFVNIDDPLGQLLIEHGEEIKFDEPHFEPFQKVLVKYVENDIWRADIFSHFNPKKSTYCRYVCVNSIPKYCIPYEGNEHLLGTTDNPKK